MSAEGKKQQPGSGSETPLEAVAVPCESSNRGVPIYQPSGAEIHTAMRGAPVRGSEAICRRCSRPFVRPVHAHDAMAQYYQCQSCNTIRVEDFCAVM